MGVRKKHKTIDGIEKKHCPTCNEWKSLSEYNRQCSSWDDLGRMCRNCTNEYKRNKRKNDPKYRKKDIEYNEKYKKSGRRKEVNAIRYQNKKEDIIKRCIAYNKKKYQTDPVYKVTTIQRRRISKIISSALKGTAYNNSKVELLGCTPLEVVNHIESQFEDGMSWDNYGIKTWHIDHIKPLSAHDLTNPDEVKLAFHYTNLQPLWASENLFKSNTYFEPIKNTKNIETIETIEEVESVKITENT